jgi:starvation-inducible outer membrane lipoprotein
MEQDGTLRTAAVYYANGHQDNATKLITDSLNTLIPPEVSYKMTVGSNPSVNDVRSGKSTIANDMVTKVKVISGPQEGWVGRAYYKLEEVNYEDKQQNVTTTVWNFHNWLSNFSPWNNYGLNNRPFWGRGSTAANIQFSIPENTTIIGGKFLLGSSNHNNIQKPRNPSYSANVVVNNINHNILNTSFTFLNLRPGTYETMYNYQGNLTSSELLYGKNNFYVNFLNPGLNSGSDMPWFSMLASYTSTIRVPVGIITDINNFTDTAGVAVPSPQNLDGNTGATEYGFSYDLNTGQRTFFNNLRSIRWSDFLGKDSPTYSDGTPFVLTNIPGQSNGCTVSKVTDINIPNGARIFDSYLVVNSYGGVDNTLVEVWNGTTWQVAFNSFDLNGVDYSEVGDGYGNDPGIIYIKDYLKNGHNKVRVTVWDEAPSSDYDLVGLTNCYTVTSYSKLPISWTNFAFSSHQSSSNQYSQVKQFTIGAEAQQAYLFFGTSTTTRHVKVDYNNNIVLYDSDTVPFFLDLAAIDAGRVITNSSGGLKPGTYNLRVTVTGPANNWESGDNNANAALFSGTRVSIVYPKFLENVWTTSYSSSAEDAEAQARADLIAELNQMGITPDESLIKEEAMYTGNLPNAIPVRLDLWQ